MAWRSPQCCRHWPDVLCDVERGELVAAWRAISDQLLPDQAQVLQCRYMEGLSIADTADRMGITPQRVKILLIRAKRSAISVSAGLGVRSLLAG